MKFWQVDAFTKEPFKGNPAAVFVLEEEISDELMQNIAIEMNLAETAFVLLRENQNPLIRWFTTTAEIDLCGHATLASSHIYFTEFFPNEPSVTFSTKWVGDLIIKNEQNKYVMDFPLWPGEEKQIQDLPLKTLNALSPIKPVKAFQHRDLMLIYEDEKVVREMHPDMNALLDYKAGIIVTSLTDNPDYDFISRSFWADNTPQEDPVTGSAHCMLAPYWSKQLNKQNMNAWQASPRGGALKLDIEQDRLLITGDAITVLKGEMCL